MRIDDGLLIAEGTFQRDAPPGTMMHSEARDLLMKTLKQACTPRPTTFDPSRRDTVLDLSDLVEDRIDPAAFFAENHVTEGMKTLLTEGFRRLEGKSPQGVFKLTQAMGAEDLADRETLVARVTTTAGAYFRDQAARELKNRIEEIFKPSNGWCYQRIAALPAIDDIDVAPDKVTLVVTEPHPGGLHPASGGAVRAAHVPEPASAS